MARERRRTPRPSPRALIGVSSGALRGACSIPRARRIVVAQGKVAIFISHTWWDRAFVDATNDPNNPYDKGAPDYQSGEKKDRKP